MTTNWFVCERWCFQMRLIISYVKYLGYWLSLMLSFSEGSVIDEIFVWRERRRECSFGRPYTLKRRCTAYSGLFRCCWYRNLSIRRCCKPMSCSWRSTWSDSSWSVSLALFAASYSSLLSSSFVTAV